MHSMGKRKTKIFSVHALQTDRLDKQADGHIICTTHWNTYDDEFNIKSVTQEHRLPLHIASMQWDFDRLFFSLSEYLLILMLQNTHEVKYECFLMSTRQNNVHIFGVRCLWQSDRWRSQLKNSIFAREEAYQLRSSVQWHSAKCLLSFVFDVYLFVILSMAMYAENLHTFLLSKI